MKYGKIFVFVTASLCSSPASGFIVRPAAVRRSPPSLIVGMSKVEPLDHMEELSEIDEFCIENVAEFCLDQACDLEEYEALVNQLQDQRDIMMEHVEKIDSLLTRLRNHDYESAEGGSGSQTAESLMATVEEKLGTKG